MRRDQRALSASVQRLGLSICAVFLAVLLLGASAAQAANSFVPSGEIGSGELAGPARIAVDPTTGNVLVVDSAEHRVDVYGSGGAGASLLTTFGASDLSSPYGIAIDPANGDVYVTDSGSNRILRYTSDGASSPTYTLDAGYTGPAAGTGSGEVGSFASAIAVDPTDGDLLVADRGNDRVSRFGPTGAFVSSFDGSDSGAAFTHLEDIAISPAGEIFVTDGEATTESRVLRFSDSGAFEATLRSLGATGDAYLAYDSKHTELIVGDGRECFFCNASIHVLNPTTGATLFNVPVPSEQLTGLASDPGSGRLYAASSRGEFFQPAKVAVLAPQMHPDLVLSPPGPITPFTAHLSGTVAPEGVATEYHFEISKDSGTTWQKSPEPDASAGEGNSPVVVETDLAVEPNAEYIARLVSSNAQAAHDATPTQSFTTPAVAPAVETRPASDIGETSAVLNGTINPFGLQTTYYFEYGPTTAYGSRTPAGIEGVAGQGRIAKSFSRTVTGLKAGETYHFRLVAKSSQGSSFGVDQTLSTVGAGAIPTRTYEQVTPIEKNGAMMVTGMGFQVSADGNGLSYLAKSGPKSSPFFSRYVSLRGNDDWQGGIGTDPPVETLAGTFLNHATTAISPDFSHALVASDRALAPGAIERGGNLYREDLSTGALEFVGGSNLRGTFASFASLVTNNVFQAGNSDLSWFYFCSYNPLLPGAPQNAMYRWSVSGGLELTSVLPDGDGTEVVIQNAYGTSQPASADGSRFYFNGVHGSEEGVFLREGGATKVVSHPEGEPAKSEPARLFGTSESGRYAFFWSRAQLTSDAPEWTGGESKDGNLYRYDASSGEIEYLAEADVYVQGEAYGEVQRPGNLGISADGQTIYFNQAGQGVSVWHDGVVHSVIPHQLGIGEERASPNGRYFVYWGAGAEGELPIERYDADTNESICVSCLPDGSPVPARLPAQGPDFEISNKTETVVDDSGTVYFDSEAALVSADVNGTRDVYAWYDGRDVLISPGDQPFAASYADASANGRDVFFTTAQQLVQRDTDRSLDVYDARIGGGLPLQNATPSKECERDCKAIVGAGAVAPPAGSEGINGPGNAKSASRPVACKKGWHKIKSKGKAKCVKSHKKQRSHGHKKQRTGKKKGGTR